MAPIGFETVVDMAVPAELRRLGAATLWREPTEGSFAATWGATARLTPETGGDANHWAEAAGHLMIDVALHHRPGLTIINTVLGRTAQHVDDRMMGQYATLEPRGRRCIAMPTGTATNHLTGIDTTQGAQTTTLHRTRTRQHAADVSGQIHMRMMPK